MSNINLLNLAQTLANASATAGTAPNATTAQQQGNTAAQIQTGISNIAQGDSVGNSAAQDNLAAAILASGLNFELPASSVQFINGLPQTQQQDLRNFAAHLRGLTLGSSAGALRGGGGLAGAAAGLTTDLLLSPNQSEGLQSRWGEHVSQIALNGGPVDINALVQWVLRESYMETTNDLAFYAEKVRFYNGVKKEIRAELTNARNTLSTVAGQAETAAVNFQPTAIAEEFFGPGVSGNAPPAPAAPANKEQLETYVQNLEEKLSSVGDDAQLANVDLQNMLQKQQQTLQLMSNISKMLHDTALAIVRKIG